MFFTFLEGQGQSYKVSAGLRLGTEAGLTAQTRVAKRATIESLLLTDFKTQSYSVAAIFEAHSPVISRRFNIYSGAGIQQKFYNKEFFPATGNPGGIVMIVGGEFTMASVNISLDFKPAVYFWNQDKSFEASTAVSLRRVLVKSKNGFLGLGKKKKKKKKKGEKKKKKINWRFWERNKT